MKYFILILSVLFNSLLWANHDRRENRPGHGDRRREPPPIHDDRRPDWNDLHPDIHNHRYLRIGDPVLTPFHITGRIINFTPNDSVVIAMDGYRQPVTYEIRRIYVGYGCLNDYVCVGERVVTSINYLEGTVIGINPYTQKVAVDRDVAEDHYSYPVRDIFVQSFCLGNLCPYDSVVTKGNLLGKILGVNPFNQTVVVDRDEYSDHYAYSVNDVRKYRTLSRPQPPPPPFRREFSPWDALVFLPQ